MRNFGGSGIYESSYLGKGHRIINIRSVGNGDYGIRISGYSHIIERCTAIDNGGNGIYGGYGCAITGNTVGSNNQSDTDYYAGIYVSSDCMVKGNTLDNNKQNNIYVYNTDNIIEENLVTDSTNGIRFFTTGNFYANNRASGNTTNYVNTAGQTSGGGNYSF